ncbi:hypothetical protein CRUP_022227, partial [Coryphaenoides rupestris]
TDFSPDWSYPEGGVKVLVTGPWEDQSTRYSCVFHQSPVPASLIQPGVLRCYCPAHEAGLVCLQVVESGGSVSSSVLFEYRARNTTSLPSSQLDWLSLDDNQFRMSILERLEYMERRMAQMASHDHQHHQHHQHLTTQEQSQVDMALLAEQIVEATPERIKREEFPRGEESALASPPDPWLATYLETMETPLPRCVLALQRLRPPSSAAWAEFLNASTNGRMERDFALLTLSDSEQRELYEAARIIQTAFRRYKGRRLKEQQDMAAAVIQRCYRKYKQYALYQKMTQAAILIQSKFRNR